MDAGNSVQAACRDVGLGFRCERSRLELRFSVTLDPDGAGGGHCLFLRLGHDSDCTPVVVDHRAAPAALLLAIDENTVQREPVMSLWLPHWQRHLVLAYRRNEDWVLERLPAGAAAATVDEAFALLDR